MVFNSFVFAVYFVIVYALYLCTTRRLALQNAMLLLASYLFYGWWDWRFLSLLGLTTAADYLAALLIDRRRGVVAVGVERPTDHSSAGGTYTLSSRCRRCILLASITLNLGVLGFFKYYNFFVQSAASLLTAVGLPTDPLLLHVILPVGVSFYTFQSMSYTIDVYRGKLRAARNPLDFALYVAFFPQLVAGPIVRAVDFLPQVTRPRRLNLIQIYEGCYLIFWGLFKKTVIADNLSPLVDRVFSAADMPSGGAVLVAVYAFAVQIYCDFSGYSDIARGCAKTMGFELNLNFNLPYFATNPTEFWRRWHISLSTWLRDYLYIPLGGNRKGPARTYVNLMLTMLLGGLWHGAAWTFVLWGALQGAMLCIHRAWSAGSATDLHAPRAGQWLQRAILGIGFFHLVCLGWLIFRAKSVGQVLSMLHAIAFTWPLGDTAAPADVGLLTLVACSMPLVLFEYVQHRSADSNAVLRAPMWVRAPIYACLSFALILFGGRIDKPFIYFQF